MYQDPMCKLWGNYRDSSRQHKAFARGEEGFSRPAGLQSPFPNEERPEFGRADSSDGVCIFGLVKNIGILVILVALIVVPKSIMQSRWKAAVPLPIREQQ